MLATGFGMGERAREVEAWDEVRGAVEEWLKAQGLTPFVVGESVTEPEGPAEEEEDMPGAAKE